MNSLDLDSLKQRWQQRDSGVSEALKLDAHALRTLLAARTRSAFARHQVWLTATAVFATALLAALLAFMLLVRHDPLYLLAGAPLLLLAGMSWAQTVAEWRRCQRLDLSAPVSVVRAELELLRARRLRLARWILWSSFLLWLPLVAVVVRGLLGGDLLRQLHPSVVWANLGLGVIVLLLGTSISARLARRPGGSLVLKRLEDDSAGGSLSALREHFEAQQVGADPLAPSPAVAALRRLQHGLYWRIWVHAGLMLLNSLYLLRYGGLASALLPGIVLQLLLVALMVSAIVQRRLLVRVLADGGGGAADAPLLQDMLKLREVITRAAGIASPLLAVMLLQVALHALGWVHAHMLPMGLGLLLLALVSMLVLWRQRQTHSRSVLRLGEVLVLGALRATRRAVGAWTAGIPERRGDSPGDSSPR